MAGAPTNSENFEENHAIAPSEERKEKTFTDY